MKKLLLFGLIAAITVLSVGSSGIGAKKALAMAQSLTSITYPTLPTITEVSNNVGRLGHPYGAVPTQTYFPGSAVINLNALGYAEKEYFVSGTANTYNYANTWGNDGKWKVSKLASNLPYTTRILVRYPTNPSKFNGTIVFEWLNETTGLEAAPDWSEARDYFLGHGYIYVGVTAQNYIAGTLYLKTIDPVRYAPLLISTDGQCWDIYSQVALAVKAQAQKLWGVTPKVLLAGGDSQSAIRMTNYVNAFQPLTKVFNGFLIHGKAATAAPLGDGLILLTPYAIIRSDNTTPVLQVDSEGDLVQSLTYLSRQPDNAYLVTWEVTGASHIDLYEGAYEMAVTVRDNPLWPKMVCAEGNYNPNTGGGLISRLPYFRVEKAAWDNLNKWATTGKKPASRPIITPRYIGLIPTIARDSYGNALGGFRLPELDVPHSTYYYWNIGADVLSAFVCELSGYDVAFSSAALKKLYPTKDVYVAKYTAAAQKLLDAGLMLKEDFDAAVAYAKTLDIPNKVCIAGSCP
jgi:hypothetical protein